MKKMRNAKKLVLLTALCAIISCGAAGGGAGDKTSDNTPTPTNPNKPIDLKPVDNNPVPINPNKPIDLRPVNKRYTEIDFSKMNYDNTNYKFKEAENKDEIGKGEYGYNIYYWDPNYTFYPDNTVTYKNKMIIKDGGIGLNFVPKGDQSVNYLSKIYMKDIIRKVTDKFKKELKNRNEIEVNEGGTYIVFNNSEVNLSDLDIRSLLDRKIEKYGYNSFADPIIIRGNGKMFKFRNSKIIIDESVNLGTSADDEYLKLMRLMINPKFEVTDEAKITGNGDNLIGVRAIGGRYYTGNYYNGVHGRSPSKDGIFWSENKGKIEMLGNNSIGVFLKGVSGFSNGLGIDNATIIVNKNSVGVYAVYDKGDFEDLDLNLKIRYDDFPKIYNTSDSIIEIGENSTGMYLYTKYYNTKMEFLNRSNGSRPYIIDKGKNATGMVFNINNEMSPTQPDGGYVDGGNSGGSIQLLKDRPTGIYVTGAGKVDIYNKNNGKIIIGNSEDKKSPGIGMYSDNPNGTIHNHHASIEIGKNSIGMAGVNGTTVENNKGGDIVIKGDNSIGMYLADGAKGVNDGVIRTETNSSDPILKNVVGVYLGKNAEFTNKQDARIVINSEGGAAIVLAGGNIIENRGTIQVSGGAVEQRTEPDVIIKSLSNRVMPVKKDLGIYVDSLGETNPIEGLANLGLKGAELLIGAEATEKTNATEVTVGKDVLDPFNKSIKESNIPYWTVGSGSLIWEANPEIKDNRVEKVTLKKQSYTKFADEKTKDVAEGLDEKYVVASEKDKQIFNYMNTLRDAESLGKVYKEIAGSQYINVQQRINQTDNLLDSQISSLQKDNAGKAGHHVETFFNKDKHDFKTEEVPNTTSTAFGASYLFNNTDSNWGAYGGVAINNYKFKDTGHSKESVSMLKAGGYKKFDLSIGDLDWTLGGDVFVSQNSMKRRIMTDKVYENKADYNAYGFSVKNEISKTYELGENSTIKPYGALRIGYGSFGKIKEKDATMGLDIKGNSYYSVKPAAGIELGYSKQVTDKTKLKASLDLAYEHELGKVDHKENEIKFINARTGYKRKSAKDESRGNLSTGVKVGLETGRFNFSVKGGYDTKDKNAHVGVGIGASF